MWLTGGKGVGHITGTVSLIIALLSCMKCLLWLSKLTDWFYWFSFSFSFLSGRCVKVYGCFPHPPPPVSLRGHNVVYVSRLRHIFSAHIRSVIPHPLTQLLIWFYAAYLHTFRFSSTTAWSYNEHCRNHGPAGHCVIWPVALLGVGRLRD